MRNVKLLALDTATAFASIAVLDGDQVLAESTWRAGRTHTVRVLSEVEALLGRVEVAPKELTGLAVTVGPGSFTGVRVGISVAKGLAVGLGLPLWGVGTLEVLASSAPARGRILTAIEAGRSRFVAATFERGCVFSPAQNVDAEELLRLADATELIVGELAPSLRDRLELVLPGRLASPAASLRRAGFLAQLALRRAEAGDPGDAAAVDAVYVGRQEPGA
ncbi:MAG: tRNA (adenosine(37)-N6)-threonylcarbamoyltransferase complex dimerization subunit type 1 TsaB [Chloroflexi bacterium]|nr:tRNA (adenosine(37)-N6)-threonylcarbamoyltransferase complex dimerization subunit type 1 TsaB [Chloroflexota bacterium]